MNSILASGLLNVGKTFLNNFSKPSPLQFQSTNNSFSTELEAVSSPIDSTQPISSLRQELLNDPALKSFISANSGNEIYLHKRADGGAQILSSSGDSMIIDPSSRTNNVIHSYYDKCVKEGAFITPHRPGCVLLEE
jgi:hypothetical protein